MAQHDDAENARGLIIIAHLAGIVALEQAQLAEVPLGLVYWVRVLLIKGIGPVRCIADVVEAHLAPVREQHGGAHHGGDMAGPLIMWHELHEQMSILDPATCNTKKAVQPKPH